MQGIAYLYKNQTEKSICFRIRSSKMLFQKTHPRPIPAQFSVFFNFQPSKFVQWSRLSFDQSKAGGHAPVSNLFVIEDVDGHVSAVVDVVGTRLVET